MSHDPSEIIIISWTAAQETILISINVESKMNVLWMLDMLVFIATVWQYMLFWYLTLLTYWVTDKEKTQYLEEEEKMEQVDLFLQFHLKNKWNDINIKNMNNMTYMI